MQSHDPVSAGARKHRRRQRIGFDARCSLCGISDPTVLVESKRSFFEAHHVLGEAHVPHLTTTVCRNCHARLSAGQLDDGVPLTAQSTLLERLLAIVLALGALLRALGEELLSWAPAGERFVEGLNTHYPTWSTQSWAV